MKVLINLSANESLRESRNLALYIKPLLEALVRANQFYIATHRVPLLYQSGVRYMQEPEGTIEEFASIPVILSRGWGDCLPASIKVLAKGLGPVPLKEIEPGMQIWGLDDWSTVIATVDRGERSVWGIGLSNMTMLRATPEHHVYVRACEKHRASWESIDELPCDCRNISERRITVGELCRGMILSQPANERRRGHLNVTGIIRDVAVVPCWDLQTDDNRVYLPEHDVTVSQCDDLCPWRVAELRNVGEKAKIRLTWKLAPNGRKEFHVQVRRGDGKVEDPSAVLGMGR